MGQRASFSRFRPEAQHQCIASEGTLSYIICKKYIHQSERKVATSLDHSHTIYVEEQLLDCDKANGSWALQTNEPFQANGL